MPLPAMQGELLPPCTFPAPHRCTFDELYQRFVLEAPFAEERQIVFDSLRIYGTLVWRLLPAARLWVDGGFVTHKQWAAPGDADVVVIITQADFEALPQDDYLKLTQLLTMQGVDAASPGVTGVPRVQPMGGMIDGFLGFDTGDPANQPSLMLWFDFWSGVTDERKMVREGVLKGFVEVVNPNA